MKIQCTNIHYNVTIEDAACEIDRDDYALESDFIDACEGLIERIIEDLPTELIVEVDDEDDDEIADAISNETNHLVESFGYKVIED